MGFLDVVCALVLGLIIGFYICVWVVYKCAFVGMFSCVEDEDGAYPYFYGEMTLDEVVQKDYILFKVDHGTRDNHSL